MGTARAGLFGHWARLLVLGIFQFISPMTTKVPPGSVWPSDPPAVLACGSSHGWHAEPLSSVLTFLCSNDLPACRKVRLFKPAVTPYRWTPDLTIRNDVVGVWNKCGTDSDGQV